MQRSRSRFTLQTMALLQGGYYFLSGVWPILHIRSFEAVTGPKKERWLVKTVGALIAVSGCVILLSARQKKVPAEVQTLAVGQAAALGFVDVFYSGIGRISKIYLLDGFAEAGLIGGWFAASKIASKTSSVVQPGIGSNSVDKAA